MHKRAARLILLTVTVAGCHESSPRVGGADATAGSGGGGGTGGDGGTGPSIPMAGCPGAPNGGGRAVASAPVLVRGLKAGSDEGWLGSPAVADLDGDGAREVIVARG